MPPIWLRLLWLLISCGFAFLWLGDPRDDGIRNVASFLLAALGLGTGFLWYVLLSSAPSGRRRNVALIVIGLGSAAAICLRITGFQGAMLPELSWRFGAAQAPPELIVDSLAPADISTTTPQDFPGFLGAARTNAVPDVHLEPDWTEHPPALLWRREVGAGWCGFAVVNGVAVTMEQRGESEAVTAYRIADGQRLWAYSFAGGFDHFLGGPGPRSTPTIAGGRVFALGSRGHLLCLKGSDGTLVWERDLLGDYGVTPEMEATNIAYGRSNSPLILGDLVVIPAGGDVSTRMAGLAAFDVETGELRWESEPRQVSFSSPCVATLAGVEQVLIVNESSASGHSTTTGRMLWEHDWPGRSAEAASVSQAVPIAPDQVLLSKGYGVGAMMLRLNATGPDTLATEVLWSNGRALRTKLTNLVLLHGHAYGLSDGILECVRLSDGVRLWREGRYGHGQILLVGERLLVITEEGELLLLEPKPERRGAELGRLQALEGKSWNHLALYGDLLILRNGFEAAVYRLALANE